MSSDEVKNLRRKLKKARESGKLQEISDCCCNLAAYLSDEEEHEEALTLYKESLKACENLGNKKGIALANRMIAEECINLGYFDDALKHVSAFLQYAKSENDKVEEQRGLVLKGHVYFTQAEYLMDTDPTASKKVSQLLEQSMEAYRKSFAICCSELNDINEKERLQMKARLLQNKSLVLSRQNKLDHAQAHLVRAIKICAKEKLNDTEHLCYLSLGDLFIKKGDFEKAIKVYDRAFELSHSTQKKRDSLIGKARTYIAMENYQEAKTTLKKAYKLRPDYEIKRLLKKVASIIRLESNLYSLPDDEYKSRRDVYKKLGDALCSLKNYKKGIKSYLNMLNYAQKAGSNKNDLISCYAVLCKALTIDKQYDKALFYSHQEIESLSKSEPDKACKTYLRIGKLHELNNSDFEEIHFAYTRAKSKAEQFKNNKLQIKCLKLLIAICNTFNKQDLVKSFEDELQTLKTLKHDSDSSCDSSHDNESEISTDSEANGQQSSDPDIKDLISDSDAENEEYDRPKERCRRTKFTIKRNEKGETDLHVAAIKGNYKRVRQLIDQGHPVRVRDTAGWTPLHEACNHGYLDIVNILLDFGADINDKGGPSCDGTTPLHDAAINGQLEIIDTLIKRGASTIVLNDAGETPLQCLLSWRKKSALDAEEDLMFKKIVEALKSPLDSEGIRRHIKPSKSFVETSNEFNLNRSSSLSDLSEVNDTKSAIKSKLKPKKNSAVSEYREAMELLRRKRQAQNRDDKGSRSEDSDNELPRPSRIKSKSASEEYREAIEDLRFKPKKTKTFEPLKLKSKPALIDEREYVENCIMDNDDIEYNEPVLKSKVEDERNEEMEWKRPDTNEDDDIEFFRPRKKIKSSPSTEDQPKKPSLEQELKSKPWLKSIPLDLLEDCFELSSKEDETECNSSSSVCSVGNEFKSEPVSSSLPVIHEVDELQEANLEKLSETVDVVVKLSNERLQIPVNKSEICKLKVSWLVNEIAKQRPLIQNPDYFVCLKSKNGSDVSESDLLDRVVDDEIELSLTKWKSLSLSQRYEKACTKTSHSDITSEVRAFGFKHSSHTQIVGALKNSNSRCFTLNNLKLSSLTLIPVCKALKYESFIQTLNLSNNYFGDRGIELIVKVFEKCIIEELNVSGCSITSSGVYHFSDALERVNELSRNGLEVLNLSHNPITDDSLEAINGIIEKLPNLKILNISQCELETSVSSESSSNLVIIQGSKDERDQGTDSTKSVIDSNLEQK